MHNAFLHGALQETVYMQQPPGFKDVSNPSHVCRLFKAIYGLKQSPRAWFNALSLALISHGYIALKYDHSLFILSSNDASLIILVYVDDIIVTGFSSPLIQAFILSLQHKFSIKDLGNLNFFLGIEVKSTSNGLHLGSSWFDAPDSFCDLSSVDMGRVDCDTDRVA